MKIEVRVSPRKVWSWQAVLVRVLATDDRRQVRVVAAETQNPRSMSVRTILKLERSHDALRPLSFAALARTACQSADTPAAAAAVIDLAASELPAAGTTPGGVRTLIPLYDGRPGEDALWAAVLSGRAPHLSIADSERASPIEIGQPAIDAPHAVLRSIGQVLVRLIEGLDVAVREQLGTRVAAPVGEAVAATAAPTAAPVGTPPLPSTVSTLTSVVARKVAAKVTGWHAKARPDAAEKWAVAWRRYPGSAPAVRNQSLSLADYHVLPDDGRRYYADPFLIAYEGEVHCFVEELPYATGRGIISHTVLRPDGTAATPRPVLDTGLHLSYPQVFARGGEVYMVPEQHQSGGLTLYRAARFPDVWEPVAQLIDEPVHDATVFEAAGRWWIVGTMAGPEGLRWGTSWDSLYVWSADDLLGPWARVGHGPARIDAARSRPAGPRFQQNGQTYRPVQDCSAGYGRAVEIQVVNETATDSSVGVAGRTAARLEFNPTTGLSGPHSFTRVAAGPATFEAIDVFGTNFDLKSACAPRQRTSAVQNALELAWAMR